MNNQIIILNGEGGCGKSTFARFCKEACPTDTNGRKYKVYELSTIDIVKKAATLCGWDGTKTAENRAFLHDLKMLLKEWNNVPNQSVIDEICKLNKMEDTTNIYFVNIRESSEITNFISLAEEYNLPITTVIVRNPNFVSNEAADLVQDIYSIHYNIIINNDGSLDDLYHKALKFMYLITTMPSYMHKVVL